MVGAGVVVGAESAALGELVSWLRIPSVSGDPRHADDLVRGGRWLARWLREAGADVVSIPVAPAPLVCAVFRGSRPGLGTSVLYGHYDVQPPGPGWTSPPFEPRVAGGRIVARGASDDKGQLFAHLVAVRSLHRRGALHGDVLVVADGSEEIGSPGLVDGLRALRRSPLAPRVPARIVLISDTQRATSQRPAVTVSQRGLVKLEVSVDVGGRAVHPGRYAGAVLDPTLVLTRAIERADRVVAALAAVRSPVSGVVLSGPDDAQLARSAGGRAGAPRSGRHGWLSTHAALSVTRIRSGGTSAAIPTLATATLDVRLPPGLAPKPVAERIIRTLRDDAVRSLIQVRVLGVARGLNQAPLPWQRSAIDAACRSGFGVGPAYVRSGGSVPAVEHLASTFGMVPALIGLGPPDDHAHGADEYFDLAGWVKAVRTCTHLWNSVTSVPACITGGAAISSNLTPTLVASVR